MIKKLSLILGGLLIIILVVFVVPQITKGKNMEKPTQIEITLGESFEEFIERYPSILKGGQDTGKWGYIKWYEFDWLPKHAATLTFKYNNDTIMLNELIHLSVTEDSDYVDKGIIELSLQAGITSEDWMWHDEARLKFHEILQGFLDKGWKRAVSLTKPRIIRSQAMHYKSNQNSLYYMDPTYLPTLDEWRNLEQKSTVANFWMLHFNSEVFMTIKIGVEDHKTDINKAAYLLFIEIVNGENEAKKYFAPKNKSKWKENWLTRLEKANATRKKREAVAIARGYKIDESYEDYVINPDDY